MKQKTKDFWNWVKAGKYRTIKLLALIISILIIVQLIKQQIELRRYQDMSQILAVELAALNDSVAVYKQKNGELNFKIAGLEVEKRNLKDALEVAGYNIKELKEKDIRWRRINNALKFKLESVGQGTATLRDTTYITERDTVYVSRFEWSNQFLSLDGVVRGREMDFSYRYQTELNIIQTPLRGKTIVTIYMADPNASIVSGSQITVPHKDKWWEKEWLWGVTGLAAGFAIAR